MPENSLVHVCWYFICFYKSVFAIRNGSGCWDSLINQQIINSKPSFLVYMSEEHVLTFNSSWSEIVGT